MSAERVAPSSWARAAGPTAPSACLRGVSACVFFFPVFWMVLNSFKEEQDANTSPKLSFEPTLDRYREVTESTGGLLSFARGVHATRP